MGISRVRPLAGGFAEWKHRGYPLEEIAFAESERIASAARE